MKIYIFGGLYLCDNFLNLSISKCVKYIIIDSFYSDACDKKGRNRQKCASVKITCYSTEYNILLCACPILLADRILIS